MKEKGKLFIFVVINDIMSTATVHWQSSQVARAFALIEKSKRETVKFSILPFSNLIGANNHAIKNLCGKDVDFCLRFPMPFQFERSQI